MFPSFLRIPFTAMLASLAFAANVHAAGTPLSDTEAQQVQAVIVAQLQAFAEDDADKAFETAAPGVKEAIGSSGRFLALVRGIYPMVYRPQSVSFLKPEKDDDQILQLVEIKDGDDKSWIALFALEQQADTTWRISGCVVQENSWTSI